MKPRERIGHCSIANAAPTGHSAPMPMPINARNRNSSAKLGASPASRLATEYQAIEIISGFLRPIRSASEPDTIAPTNRIHSVIASTAVTSTSGTLKVCEIGSINKRKIVKTKASRVQPSHAAIQACHCSRVGSLHHGSVEPSAATAILTSCSRCVESEMFEALVYAVLQQEPCRFGQGSGYPWGVISPIVRVFVK